MRNFVSDEEDDGVVAEVVSDKDLAKLVDTFRCAHPVMWAVDETKGDLVLSFELVRRSFDIVPWICFSYISGRITVPSAASFPARYTKKQPVAYYC